MRGVLARLLLLFMPAGRLEQLHTTTSAVLPVGPRFAGTTSSHSRSTGLKTIQTVTEKRGIVFSPNPQPVFALARFTWS